MEEQKLSQEEFVLRAIEKLRKPPYKGIHTVYSGFNQAFRAEYDADPVAVTNRMAKEGKITIRPVKGGVMLYLAKDAPGSINVRDVLKKIKED